MSTIYNNLSKIQITIFLEWRRTKCPFPGKRASPRSWGRPAQHRGLSILLLSL